MHPLYPPYPSSPPPQILPHTAPHISHASGAATNGPWGADGEHGVAQARAWIADNQPDDGADRSDQWSQLPRAGASNPKGRLLDARVKNPVVCGETVVSPFYLPHEAPLAACRLSTPNRPVSPRGALACPLGKTGRRTSHLVPHAISAHICVPAYPVPASKKIVRHRFGPMHPSARRDVSLSNSAGALA